MNTAIDSKKTDLEKIYQGIGVIYGRVTIDEEGKYSIDIEGQPFRFKPTKRVRNKLTTHLEKHPDAMVYLRVYPKYNLNFHQLWFQAIAFYPNKPESTHANQFLLAGIWQYIPHFPDQPVMSIYRNSLQGWEKKEHIKTNHLPLQGFTEEAYRYELKNAKETPHKRKFYQLLVSLNPEKRAFEYVITLDSTEDIPPYVKTKYKKQKPDQPKLTKKVKQMNFSLLQKTAIKLREAGFLEGKVSGKGVTKDALFAKVQDSLSNHPEAVKILEMDYFHDRGDDGQTHVFRC